MFLLNFQGICDIIFLTLFFTTAAKCFTVIAEVYHKTSKNASVFSSEIRGFFGFICCKSRILQFFPLFPPPEAGQ